MSLRFRADSSLRRFGNLVIGGSPLRLFRMSHGGALAVDAMVAGDQLSPLQLQLAQRLADAGALHPEYSLTTSPAAATTADVTVVVPSFGTEVPHVPAFGGVREVIVVDDASPTPLAAAPLHRLVRREHNGGPGAATLGDRQPAASGVARRAQRAGTEAIASRPCAASTPSGSSRSVSCRSRPSPRWCPARRCGRPSSRRAVS